MRLALVRHCSILAAVVLLAPAVSAAERVDYLRDVKPIFKKHCYSCHGSLKQEGTFRADTAKAILNGGDSGSAAEPGNAKSSHLLARITDADEATRMPKESAPLSPSEIAMITTWIEQGAVAPDDEEREADPLDHWAFRRPLRPQVPLGPSRLPIRNPIDAFIAEKHQQHQLRPVNEANKPSMLRRVTLDLIGLPPTREDLHAFLNDDSPDAYERVVDRLLASPQYGERWGRHWMDVWRYSDWYGRRSVPDVMSSYPTIWRWRDWIVQSLNTDKGYDRMIVEMLAGDEVAPEDDSVIVATGFLVRNWFKWNYGQWMKDNVEHTGKAFLGLTINCAHCHDHKYDPISQRDYFAFRAFFEPLDLRQDRVPGEPDPGKFKDYVYTESYGPIPGGMIRVYDRRLDAVTKMYARGDERSIVEGESPVEPALPGFLNFEMPQVKEIDLPPVAVYPGLKSFIFEEETAKLSAAIATAQQKLADAQARFAADEATLVAAVDAAKLKLDQTSLLTAQRSLDALRLLPKAAEAELAAAKQELVSLQAREAAGKARFATSADAQPLAKEAALAERSANNLRLAAAEAMAEWNVAEMEGKAAAPDQVAAAKTTLASSNQAMLDATVAAKADANSEEFTLLSPTYPAKSTGRRTMLARAIASRDNPLTARVAVNHIWMRHFGQPLVESVFDFGRNGKLPTHPELLDWLAVEFMENGWSMRHLHRLIVLSSAYRLETNTPANSPNVRIDPDNKLLWRFARKRMESELIRDSILFAAGQLDLKMGGPEIEIKDAPTCRRRSIYLSHHGEDRAPLMEAFDGADPNECYRRIESVVPQQALALANGDLAIEASRVIARKLWTKLAAAQRTQDNGDLRFVEAAYDHLLTRQSTPYERKAALTLLEQQRKVFVAAGLTGDEPALEDGTRPSLDPAMRARESLCHAMLNCHDFISIP
jgi:hypothetical protein